MGSKPSTPALRIVTRRVIATLDPPSTTLAVMDSTTNRWIESFDLATLEDGNALPGAYAIDGGDLFIALLDGQWTLHTKRPFSVASHNGIVTLVTDDGAFAPGVVRPVDVVAGAAAAAEEADARRVLAADVRARIRTSLSGILSLAELRKLAGDTADVSTPEGSDGDKTPKRQDDCPVCNANPRNVAFECGHALCAACTLRCMSIPRRLCPMCQQTINAPRRLYLN